MTIVFLIIFIICSLLIFRNMQEDFDSIHEKILVFILSSLLGGVLAFILFFGFLSICVLVGDEKKKTSEMVVLRVISDNERYGMVVFHDTSLSQNIFECEKTITFDNMTIASSDKYKLKVFKDVTYSEFMGEPFNENTGYRIYIDNEDILNEKSKHTTVEQK